MDKLTRQSILICLNSSFVCGESSNDKLILLVSSNPHSVDNSFDDLGSVISTQFNLPHTAVVKIKWMKGKSGTVQYKIPLSKGRIKKITN